MEIVKANSVEEAIRHATGEAAEAKPHFVMQCRVPLALSLPREGPEGLMARLRDLHRRCPSSLALEGVESGRLTPIALCHHDGDPFEQGAAPTQLLLVYGRLGDDSESAEYWTFNLRDGDADYAVLVNGHGRRHATESFGELKPDEALGWWAAGYWAWEQRIPSLNRMRYALIEG
jgi:hypothetical protein